MMSDGAPLRGASYTSIILQNTEQVKHLLRKEKSLCIMLNLHRFQKEYGFGCVNGSMRKEYQIKNWLLL